MKLGPYKSTPPASTPRAHRGRIIVASEEKAPAVQLPGDYFVTAIVERFVKDKRKRKRRTR